MSSVKITSLAVENVKKVKAVHLVPSESGLTVLGGKNGQGKTTVLDAIAWALGGAKYSPSNPQREGAMSDPHISLTLSNGIKVERKGKNSSLKVTDPSGAKAGQQLLDSFVSQFALDLPKFINSSNREKADVLLDIIGVGPELAQLEEKEALVYQERHAMGQIASSKTKHAEELPEYADAPDEPVSVKELLQQQQGILAKNGENQRLRSSRDELEHKVTSKQEDVNDLQQKLLEAQEKLDEAVSDLAKLRTDYFTACSSAENLQDESTAELEKQLEDIEAINSQVAANQQKATAQDEAAEYQKQYDAKGAELESIRATRRAVLDNAELPLPGLSVADGELVFNGQKWDGMSGAEQLRVAVSIVKAQSPQCGFVLMDKLEQMDMETLTEFGQWLEQEGLQTLATRVSTGDECSIVIEDGLPAGETYVDVTTGVKAPTTPPPAPETKDDNPYGEF